jgi:hypothetical protein
MEKLNLPKIMQLNSFKKLQKDLFWEAMPCVLPLLELAPKRGQNVSDIDALNTSASDEKQM